MSSKTALKTHYRKVELSSVIWRGFTLVSRDRITDWYIAPAGNAIRRP